MQEVSGGFCFFLPLFFQKTSQPLTHLTIRCVALELSAQDGDCELHLVVDQGWINAAGYTHGSVAYAVMDSACAYASASLQKLAVTVNGNVTYTRGTQEGARLNVRAQLLSQSKRVMTFNAQIVDERERLIAHGSFVFQIIGDR